MSAASVCLETFMVIL